MYSWSCQSSKEW